ncbi:MAG: putative addiction module antidote protein [Gammaproteobacteria bacterium]|nr:putative addiction module antidote protein [Gammaproteobacteria bacterium]
MKIKKFDVVDFLGSDEAIIEYLNAALEEGDSDFFVKAVGDVARAKGMMKIAKTTGLGRQNLYRSLSRGGNPRVGTLFRVLDALDVRLSVAR